MFRFAFFLVLAIFSLVWLGITAYTLLAIGESSLLYTVETFWTFIILLDILGFLALLLWWKVVSKTIIEKTWMLMCSVILIFYWGLATIYSFLILALDNLQFRWIAFAYIWEVVVVGIFGAYLVVRISRFAELFLSEGLPQKKGTLSPRDIHRKIAFIPLRAALTFFAVVVFGYSVGSLQLSFFSRLPFTEIVKNLTTGITTGAISSFFVFFFLERIIDPALKKSGAALETKESEVAHPTGSLFIKIYAISGLLALVAVGFFGTLAYARGQEILEDQLKIRMSRDLEIAAYFFHETGGLWPPEEIRSRFGPHGELALTTESLPDQESIRIVITRNYAPAIVGFYPVAKEVTLRGILVLGDFDQELQESLFFNGLIFILILVVVVVISTLFAHSITWPIQKIKEGGIRIGRGEFTEPIGVYTNDELEEVGRALNETGRKLQKSYEHLEEEVEKRTHDLEEASRLQQKQIKEFDQNAKLLIQRGVELSEARERGENQLRELDMIAKRLVRRDFELLQVNERLREMDEAKSHFVSIAAHQLRTPLSGLKWMLHMVLGGDFGIVDREQKGMLKEAQSIVERLIRLVRDLLDVARIEEGRFSYKFVSLSIEEVCRKVVRENEHVAHDRKISLRFSIPEDHLPFIFGDFNSLVLVVENMVENALLYTSPGGLVEIRVERDPQNPDQAKISVKDTGMGIPEFQKHLVGQKFFRADNVMRKQIPGTGLGLYIAYRILERHQGKLDFDSEEEKGTTFFITLPFFKK